jgi:hypothetical protein
MTKWLRFEAAVKSPHYQKMRDAAIRRLREWGHFSKHAVMQETEFDVFDDGDIRWDYIKLMIDEELGTELMPVAQSFFNAVATERGREAGLTREQEVVQFPGRFLAQGHGKKCAGYALMEERNGHFVLRYLNNKRSKAGGTVKAANKTLETAQHSIAVSKRPMQLLDDAS